VFTRQEEREREEKDEIKMGRKIRKRWERDWIFFCL
jgi:hypothetical protein